MKNSGSVRTRNMIKRVASMFMAILFAFVFVYDDQYKVFADSSLSNTDTSMDTGLDISGSNSLGNLVAEGLMAKNTEQMENNGYNVFSVDIENTLATVSFETLRDCSLVIGIYDNEGESMLAIGTAEVIAGETKAFVEIDTDSMPEYFYIRAYLVDSDTLRPLCTEYSSPMYTRSMQKFLSKTVNDFDPNRVMNLDDNEDTNFAVFSEDTKLIPTIENVNEVISANPETQEYVFANVDGSITSLETGDIFAYEYDGEVLIIKVGSISVDGTQATIVGEDTELDEVFEHLRIDGKAPTETAKTDASELEDGITYLGCTEDVGEISTYGIDLGGSTSWSHKFTFGETGDEYKDDTFSGKYKFTGSLDLKLEASAKVYISWGETYFEIKLNISAKFVADFNATASRKSIPLAFFEISPITGVIVRIKPAFIIEGQGECKSDITFSWTTGFKASTSSGKQNLTSNPKVSLNSEATVTIFIGFSLEPEMVILHKKIASATLEGKAGVEIKATVVKMSTDSKGVQHDCESCIDGDISAKVNLTATVKLLNKESMKFDFKMVDVTVHLMDFYYSFDFNEWGLKECPHISYPVNVRVVTTKSAPISGAKIVAGDQTRTATTDESGIAKIMLSPGVRTITVTAEGYKDKKAIVTVSKFTKSAKVKLYAIGENTPIEEFKQFLDDAIKKGASNPEDVDYNLDIIPEELRELKVKELCDGGFAAITEDNSLYTWNYRWNEYDYPSAPQKILENISYAFYISNSIGMAISLDGVLYSWGKNSFGRLGNGTENDNDIPQKILENVSSVEVFSDFCVAITNDGTLYSWGNNVYGQLGNGSTENNYYPTKILDNVRAVRAYNSAFHPYCAAITNEDELYMWGNNSYGFLGDGTYEDRLSPVKVLNDVFDVQLGENGTTAAITKDGNLYIWGSNVLHVGNDPLNCSISSSNIPIKILENVKQVELGIGYKFNGTGYYYHSAAITNDGNLYMWGISNKHGQLGIGTSEMIYEQYEQIKVVDGCPYWTYKPIKVLENVSSVYIGDAGNQERFSAAVTNDSNLYMWGWNLFGQLGNGNNSDIYYPVKILNNVVQFDCSDVTAGSMTKDGTLYFWGAMNNVFLEDGTELTSSYPQKIMENISSIKFNGSINYAITNDGSLYSWNLPLNGYGLKSYLKKMDFPMIPVAKENTSSLRSNSYIATTVPKSLTNLIPNEIYNYYSVNSRAASNMLSGENLLYIGQAISDENGALIMPDYVPNGKIFVKAMTEFDVYNADITSAETKNNAVSITWNPVDGASAYEVMSFSENGVASYPITSDTSISINDLERGDYGFVVTSIVYGEQSVPALNDIVLVHIDEPTKVPTLTVTDADGKAQLSWEDIDNALAYKVYSYKDGEYNLLTFTAENSFTVQDLTVGEKYGFIVSACVKDVWSELSESNVVYITIGSHTHDYSTDWKYDNSNHWRECACGNKTDIAAHTFDSNGQCTVCSANMVKQTVVVTFPDSVMVTTSLDVIIHNGDEVTTGDKLHIDVTIPDGKKLTSLTVNGVSIENGATYTVGTENVVIAVMFDDITAPPAEKIVITIPENVVVTRDGIAINTGDEIHSGDVLRIEATVPAGKKLTSLTVNGVAIENGSTYTVGSENVIITVAFEDIETPPTNKYTITIPSGITVTRSNITLNNGDEISEGDVLNIKANIPSGYKLTSLTVNGKSVTNGDTFTVGKENVIIAFSFEKLADNNPNIPDTPSKPDDDSNSDVNNDQPFIISNSDIIGWNSILSELNILSGKTVMVDMNGTTVLPANILQVIKNNNIKLMLKMDDQVSWSIDGKDVEKIDHDVDLKVVIGADNIPDEAIKKFVGKRKYLTLSIKHNGDFGFSAFLVIDVGEQYSNEPATLYWFNDNAFKSEDSCKIQYGKAVLKFTHASDWIIAFGEAENNTDSDNSNSDNSTDDTSRPIDAKPNETKPDESSNSKPTTTDPNDSSDDEKDNPHTGGSRVSLATFLALITSAALCLITRKQKR